MPATKNWNVRLGSLLVLCIITTSIGVSLAIRNAPATTQVHLTAAGDFGARASTASVLDKAAALHPDAHLALGDLAYRDLQPESAWCDFVKARTGEGFPFQLISGNHESLDVADGAINNYSACLPNQIPGIVGTYGREYYMDFPRGAPLVRVIQASPSLTFEDGVWRYLAGDAHYNWLANAIDSGRALGARWIIVTSHVPCQSVGTYTCPSTDFFKLLAAKKVDLVMHGHEHAYMRTHQLSSGSTGCATIPVGSFNSACVADSDNNFAAGAGTVFATVGTGGTPLRDVNPSDAEAGYFASYAGLNANPTFGLLDITITETSLSARFEPTSGGNFSDSFTITRGASPPNQPPVATMTTSVQDLSVTVDGSTSSDPDGAITDHSWAFGDGATATGAAPPTHTYASAGTYTVTLTVTDDDGATGTTTTSVTVTEPTTGPVLAADGFERAITNGLGVADIGGAWTVSGGAASGYSVLAGTGRIAGAVAGNRAAYLTNVRHLDIDMATDLAIDRMPAAGSAYVSLIGRRVSNGNDYRLMLRYMSDGTVVAYLIRTVGGTATTLSWTVVPNLVVSPGDELRARLQIAGTTSPTVRAKIWRTGASEPQTWMLTNTTAAPTALQQPGDVGLLLYLSGTWTGSPAALSVDNLSVIPPAEQ